MNILILSGSPRNNGNTDLLVEAFAKGASEKHHIEIVSVHDYTVHPCTGCDACFSSEGNACVQNTLNECFHLIFPFLSVVTGGSPYAITD